MKNNRSPECLDCSDEVWQPRNQTTSECSELPVTTRYTEVVNRTSSLPLPSNGLLIGEDSSLPVVEDNVSINQDRTTDNLQRAKNVRQSLRSFLRKATSLKDSRSNLNIECSVIGLDGKCFRFNLCKFALGRELFDLVCQCLELGESQYFGLAYYLNRSATRNSTVGTHRDEEDSSDVSFRLSSSSIDKSHLTKFCGFPMTNSFNPCKMYSNDTTYPGFNPFFIDVPFWLDVEKRITDQCHGSKMIFYFQVKFYPQHPDLVFDCPKSRYQFCLQLRHHLSIGRLLCSFETHVILGALIAQMDLGNAVKHRRSRSGHSSCRSNPYVESTSHDFSRRQSTSPARSFSSERRCSLAQPEHSDDSIIWDARVDNKSKIDKPCSSSVGNKTSTCNHIGCSCSTQQIDNISIMYLQCLPHLARGSVTSSSIQHSTNDISNGSRPSLLSSTLNNIEDVLLSPVKQTFSPGWPYPKSDCRYCPVLLSRIARLHRNLRGMPQKDAEISFLKNVKKLSFYGVELHPIKKFHASYISSGSFKNITKKLANSFSTRSRTSSVESYHNFIDTSSIGSNQLLNSNRTHNSLSISGLKSSLRRMFSVKSQDQPLFPFAFNDYPNFDFSLGVYFAGLFLQWGHIRLSHYKWSRIVKICFYLDEFCLVVKSNHIKSSSSPRILLKCKFAFQKLARRFYRACVEHHMFFKIHCKHLVHSNINKRESCKTEPIVLPVNHTLHVNNELLNHSVSINGPCSIKLLSVSNLQSPKLPATPTRSEFELDQPHSSNAQLNNCEFSEYSEERVHTPQTDSKSRTNMDSHKNIYSNGHLLLPCTSNELSTRSASFSHLDNYSVAHIPSPIECSSRLDILNSSVNDDNIDDRCRSANIPSYDCLQISDDRNSNSFDCLCRITSTQTDIHSSFNINDNPAIDSVYTYSENPNFKPSTDDTCQTLLACEIPNLLPSFIPINCALTNPMEEYLPTDVLHCLSASEHISSDFSQIDLTKPTDSLWCCNLLSSLDLNSLNKIIAPSYSSVISSNGEIIRLDPPTNNDISKSSMSSLVPCDFFRWNSIEKQLIYHSIPIVRTRTIRFILDPSIQINEYKTFNHSKIHIVHGTDIPLVSTRSFYHH
uniref:FERM domain-containing protein n=2 Tax=Schistosoma mansoni TaxID=6183 RepID=A0A3Q0KPV4_SCHMA